MAAIATAAGLVREGACDVAVAGGVDESVAEFDRAWDRLRLVFRGDAGDFPGPFDRPEEIGYVAASANGSRLLDAVEARVVRQILGPVARRVPVTSVNGAIGESGSASAAAAVVAARSVCQRFIPPVAGLVDPDPELGLNLVVGRARHGPVPSVVINALGTGGSCAAVVLKHPSIRAIRPA